ncbi:GlsB/YeaQ/YmgE family stress response membrane protein [Labilibaculum sp.]|uniref:GlsB/YeaQ/YmgE family stress response membrane protein n=1 Tax=Labilibaculum sp. TaxID=2060723 RepID=UPI003562E0D0
MIYLIFLLIGLIAGWMASILLKGKGNGLLINLLLGVLGAFVGGSIFSTLGIHLNGFFGVLLSATLGSIFIIWLVSLFQKNKGN